MESASEIPGGPDDEKFTDSIDEEAAIGAGPAIVGVCWSLSSALLAARVIAVASLAAPQLCVHDSFALMRFADRSDSFDMW